MKVAQDLMSVHVETVDTATELRAAAHLFIERGLKAIPVLSATKEVMGVLSETALMQSYIKNYLSSESHESIAHHFDLLDEPCFVSKDTEATDVVKKMIKSSTHRVLVVDDHHHLLGTISPVDVLAYLLGEELKTEDLRNEVDKATNELCQMGSELRTTQKLLASYKDLYSDTPMMMHSVDMEGVIVMANRRIHKVLRYGEGELIGMSIYEIYSKSYHQDAKNGLKRIVETGTHQTTYTTMIDKDGQPMRVEVISSALRTSGGEFMGTISVSRKVEEDMLLRALHRVSPLDGDPTSYINQEEGPLDTEATEKQKKSRTKKSKK